MTFSEEHSILVAKMRNLILSKVRESNVKSSFLIHTNCLLIPDLFIEMGGFEIVEVLGDCLVASNGIPYHFEEIPFSDLCSIADSL
jgi:hypothetical protein